MKKKFASGQKIITLLLFAGLFASTSFKIINSQTPPKLTILKAELGIFDNKVKNEELVAFKNSPGIWRDPLYAATHENWLEQLYGDIWFILSNSNFNKDHQDHRVFKIDKVFPSNTLLRKKYDNAKLQVGKKFPEYDDKTTEEIFKSSKEIPLFDYTKEDALRDDLSPFDKETKRRATFVHQYKIKNYEITEDDTLQLRIAGALMGLQYEQNWGYRPFITDQPQPAGGTNWQLTKVNKNGKNIEHLSKIYIESRCPSLQGQRIQRWGVMMGIRESRASILAPGKEYPRDLHIKENAYFDIYRLAPEPNRLNLPNCPKIDVTTKLKDLIANQAGLTKITDGITFPQEKTGFDWKKYFGNPLADSSGISNLWLQLKVLFKIGNKTYERIFNEWEEKVQIPTEKELEVH